MLPTTRREFLGTTGAALAGLAIPAALARRAFAADDFSKLDATALAELVRSRKASPLEIVQATIARIERLNPKINAVVTQTFKQAMLDAVTKVASTSVGDDCGEGFSAPPAWASLFASLPAAR